MNGIRCPECGWFESNVVDSRGAPGESIRRRRLCTKCKTRFTTYERSEQVTDTLVDAKRERDELLEAMHNVLDRRAAEKAAAAEAEAASPA